MQFVNIVHYRIDVIMKNYIHILASRYSVSHYSARKKILLLKEMHNERKSKCNSIEKFNCLISLPPDNFIQEISPKLQ